MFKCQVKFMKAKEREREREGKKEKKPMANLAPCLIYV